MVGVTNRQMGGCIDRLQNRLMTGQKDRWTEGCIDRRVDGQKADGQKDRWTEG